MAKAASRPGAAILAAVVLLTLSLRAKASSGLSGNIPANLNAFFQGLKPLSPLSIGASKPKPESSPHQDKDADWGVYGGMAGDHYSKLTQINRENVTKLAVAWTFDTGEEGGLQSSPLIVDGVLYGLTPSQKVFALDAATGRLLWRFEPGIKGTQPNRGLAYWASGEDKRIFAGAMNFLYALDAKTGNPVEGFGSGGRIDLREGLGREPASAQSIYLTSPAVVYKDLVIVGGRNPETLPAPPGDIRAFDARTGKPRWSFHTIPHPGEYGYDTWPRDAWKTSGAANNWAGMTLDGARGIVYVPTGSAAFDFYGGDRLGDNLFANCLIALDAATGARIWHFQGVRHDVWDRDFPAPPALLTVERDGRRIDAVAQTSKQGFVFLFDRANGRPLFPLEYKRYRTSKVPGEFSASAQPLPAKPGPFSRQLLTEEMLTNRTPAAHEWALERFRQMRSEGQFVPLGLDKETIVFPGFDGGAEWGGPAVDPETGIIYVNANDVAWSGRLTENTDGNGPRGIYMSQCSVCHGEKMTGSPPAFPSLVGIGSRMTLEQVAETVKSGKGRMPGFPNLTDDQRYALADFVMGNKSKELTKPASAGMKYRFTGYLKFLDPEGYPAVAPPWGTLSAINLNTGEYVWKIPLGVYPELAAQGKTDTGSENYGGPVVTAGGLLFIGATNFDKKFRAFDKATGELLWETTLPFSGNATPVTYQVNGRQFVVIAAGGGKDPKSQSWGVYVAFALQGASDRQPY